jgi:hypothetical protein
MRIRLSLLFVALACTPTHVAPVPSDTDVASDEHASATMDISGTWVGGTGPEPSVPVVMVEAQCRYTPPVWVLEQHGDTVLSYRFPEHWEQGTASRETRVRAPSAIGRMSGAMIVLLEGKDKFRLQFDSASGHLRGTRNAEPFWAARQEIARKELCPAVP